MFIAARTHAQRVYHRFVKAARSARTVQERVLLEKIRRNADTAFGHDFGFARIRSIADFVRQVPILSYEHHRPYIERVKNGELTAMFGSGQRVHMFAMTSGTTAEPKYIPVTDPFLKEYRQGWNAFGIKALLDHPEGFLRPIVQVSSRMDESRTLAGIPCGAITGLMAATQKRLVRKYYLTPLCVAHIEDPLAKYYTIMRLSVASDVAFLITASPATQLKLARVADEHRQDLIRDIHDGTLSARFDVPEPVRAQLAPRLKADPEVAAALDALVHQHGRLLPRHYWRLAFIANWTGGTMGLYLRDFPEYFGDIPVRDIGLLASEGRLSVPIEDGTPSGILDVTSNFIEFVPRDCMGQDNPPVLRCHELEVGEEYFLLLTTSSGLYRYDLGDLVRVTGYFGEAPLIEFLNKGAHTCSLAGEKLTEHQVMLAAGEVAAQLGLPMDNFVLAPRWDSPPWYVLHMEESHLRADDLVARLEEEFDRRLQAVNIEYASRRHSRRLARLQVNRVPTGFLAQEDRRRAERHRRGNEQYKHQYLLCTPGDDDQFPLERRLRAAEPQAAATPAPA